MDKVVVVSTSGCSIAFNYGRMLHDALWKAGVTANLDVSRDTTSTKVEKAILTGYPLVFVVDRSCADDRDVLVTETKSKTKTKMSLGKAIKYASEYGNNVERVPSKTIHI